MKYNFQLLICIIIPIGELHARESLYVLFSQQLIVAEQVVEYNCK